MQSATLSFPYGAFELKRFYQPALGRGTLISVLMFLSIPLGYKIYAALTAVPVEPPITIVIGGPDGSVDIPPPPSVTHRNPLPTVANPDIALPAIGIPTPVPDEQVTETVKFATRDDLAVFNAQGTTDDFGDANVVVNTLDQDDYFPQQDEFVAVQEMPIIIKAVMPVYPEVATLTGREGTVWVKALVDKEGKVREARVAKSSGSNVGFDEAALAAAYSNVYKPAIQNGRPVAIWVTYPVEFKLK